MRRTVPWLLSSLILLTILYSSSAPSLRAAPHVTLVVRTTADTVAVDGFCSLREAIQAANSNASVNECVAGDAINLDTITFDIGIGTPTINLSSALPTITDDVFINGNTGGADRIELNGVGAGAGVNGLTIAASGAGSTISSLVINRFSGHGVAISGGSGNAIYNSYIGLDATGHTDLGNGLDGINITNSADNIIGFNAISGNGGDGVEINGTTASGNRLAGNAIGTDHDADYDLGNEGNGVNIVNAPNNQVGGVDLCIFFKATKTTHHVNECFGNVISGNGSDGVEINGTTASGNKVQYNIIGTDFEGVIDVGNDGNGVYVLNAPNNTLGGTGECPVNKMQKTLDVPYPPCLGNLISGNALNGVAISGVSASGNQVLGNLIGTDFYGEADLGNTQSGVYISGAPNNTVGNAAFCLDPTKVSGVPVADCGGNLISGNDLHGVEIAGAGATGNTLLGNYIGTDKNGDTDLGNSEDGVAIHDGASSNTVGSSTTCVPAAKLASPPASLCGGNLISGNGGDGVALVGATVTGNTVLGNYIGTDISGTVVLGNSVDGVYMSDAVTNTVGSATAGLGNLIAGNGGDGVEINDTVGGNVVLGNFIGTDVTGTVDLGNDSNGVRLGNASNNTIGGTSGTTPGGPCTGACNLIAGNDIQGVTISGGGSSGNYVLGNFIGTDVNGTADLGNTQNGVSIAQATGNTIGSGTAAGRNVISGNDAAGVTILLTSPSGNIVQGNFIGLDTTGTVDLGNTSHGVYLFGASGNTIGMTLGTTPGSACMGGCNVIAGNGEHGVIISGTLASPASFNFVQSNFIGTDVSGTLDRGNDGDGVLIDGGVSNRVGGTMASERNVIAGNTGHGVRISGPDATLNGVSANFIGVQTDGVTAQPNDIDGVRIEAGATANEIGGTIGTTPGGACTGACNVISANGDDGVEILSHGNFVYGNFIGTDVTGTLDRGNTADGVLINGSANNTIGTGTAAGRNLISGNGEFGVDIRESTATSNTVQGNFIGTDTTGAADLGNDVHGVLLSEAPKNTIGGTSGTTPGGACTGACNLISGNDSQGVAIDGPNASNNMVLGNFIGTNLAGTAAIPNEQGIGIGDGANTIIGGTSAQARNVISGNANSGIRITKDDGTEPTGIQILGNFIGTDTTGTADLGNGEDGVSIDGAANNFIGGALGTTPGGPCTGACNVISGNGDDGVDLANGATGNTVQGNHIGTNAAGTADLGNADNGVVIYNAPTNTIGGSVAGAGNLISGNDAHGVVISQASSAGNIVQGNWIGTQANGASPLGNAFDGVRLIDNPTSNLIGGTLASAGNTIRFNGQDGVSVAGPTAFGNAILRNSIDDNGQLGIDLGNNGPTANDTTDPDTGPNNFQNYPVVRVETGNAVSTTVGGTLNSLANSTFRIEIFVSPTADATLFGEGRTFLTSLEVTTNGAGDAAFNTVIPVGNLIGQAITATATRLTGPGGTAIETSEFSKRAIVQGPSKPAVFRNGTWFLRNTLTGGPADISFLYGANIGDIPLMCDWDGDGVKTPGVFRNGTFFLRNSNTSGFADLAFGFGLATDTPICGDWDGDGIETIGVTRNVSNIKTWFLRNDNSTGIADISFQYGLASDKPVVGDWNGDGFDTIGIFRDAVWYLRNTNSAGAPDLVFQFGAPPSDLPLVGDWNGDGTDTVGVLRGNAWLLRNSNTGGIAEIVFQFGLGTDIHLVWR